MHNVLFIDLQTALTDGKPFVGFAPNVDGPFVDFHGRSVEVKPSHIKQYLANTLQAIRDMQARGMDGLPIDTEKHDKGKAAGWIIGAELAEIVTSAGRKVPAIQFIAKWTKLGRELIEERILTNFSPTFDLKEQVIKGGSLTNWPASVDERGVPLFNAIELSQGVHYLEREAKEETEEVETSDSTGGGQPNVAAPEIEERPDTGEGDFDMGDETKDTRQDTPAPEVNLAELRQQLRQELAADIRKEVISELAPGSDENPEEALARLRESLNLEAFADVADLSQARDAMLKQMQAALKTEYDRMQKSAGSMLADMMQQIKRDQHIAELSERWTGGTEQNPRGLPVGREEVETFLANLSDKNRAAAESILGRVWQDGLTEFVELGHGKRLQGTAELEPAIAAQLQRHVKAGGSIDDFFAAAGDVLGDRSQYNLSAYEEDNNG